MMRPSPALSIPGLLMLCLLGLSACRQVDRHARFFVFGTLVDVTISAASTNQADQAIHQLQALLQKLHRDWHPWEDGALMAINHAIANNKAFSPDDDMQELIRLSQQAEQESCGRFNAASGQLIHLWGFHTSDYPIHGPPPAAAAIETIVATRPSTVQLTRHGRQWRSDNAQLRLDFSALAKGLAVDRAIAQLRGLGIQRALVNAGGDLMAYGATRSQPWKVAIKDTRGEILSHVEVTTREAVFTSGNYARFRTDADVRYAHILDPNSGWPVKHVAAATVIHPQGWRADAAATALMVAGPDARWAPIAARMGIREALIIREDGGVELTPAMGKRLHGRDWQKRVRRWVEITAPTECPSPLTAQP